MESFVHTFADFPRIFSCYLGQLFCREPVSAHFCKKEVRSRRYLRCFKNTQDWSIAEGCSLAACKLLKRNSVRDHSLETSCILRSSFKKYGEKFIFSSVTSCRLQARIFVKTGTFAISRRATFWNVPADVFKFSIELRNAESSPVPLLKSNSTTNALSAILEIIRTLTGNFYCWVSFQETFLAGSVFSIVVSGWIGQLEILKRNSGTITE